MMARPVVYATPFNTSETAQTFKNRGKSITAANCPIETFAHEIGHNLGSGHNIEASYNAHSLPYAFGI